MLDMNKIHDLSNAVSSVINVNVKLSPQLHALIKLYCKNHGKSQQSAIRDIIQDYLINLYLEAN